MIIIPVVIPNVKINKIPEINKLYIFNNQCIKYKIEIIIPVVIPEI